jgi:hypothetical protein
MHWIAPSEKHTATDPLGERLWAAADELRAKSGLTSQQYGQPGLSLIFLHFPKLRFAAKRAQLESRSPHGWESVGVGGEGYSDARSNERSIHSLERTGGTGRGCRPLPGRKDLPAHGLEGDFQHGGNVNNYDGDAHDATGSPTLDLAA